MVPHSDRKEGGHIVIGELLEQSSRTAVAVHSTATLWANHRISCTCQAPLKQDAGLMVTG